jgi:hypothetical protein
MAYRPILVEVIDRLYVGDEEAVPQAEKRGMSILAACKDGSSDCHRAVLKYSSLAAPRDKDYYFVQRGDKMALNLIDSENPAFVPDEVIDAGLRFLKREYDAGKKVFCHCVAGKSRSPSLMLAFLRTIGEMPHSFQVSEKVFRTLYPHYDPARGIRTHVRERWAELPTFFKH